MNENENLSPLEEEKISSLVSRSYPTPDAEISARVSEKIAVIKAARLKRRKLLLRIGSAAACLVIVGSAAFAVLPKMMTKTAVSEDCANEINGTVYDAVTEECADVPAESKEMLYDAGFESNDAAEADTYSLFGGYGFAPAPVLDDENANEIPDPNGELPMQRSAVCGANTAAFFDADGDGESEYCEVFAESDDIGGFSMRIVISKGETVFEGLFPMSECTFNFEKDGDGMVLRLRDSASGEISYRTVVLDDGEIILK